MAKMQPQQKVRLIIMDVEEAELQNIIGCFNIIAKSQHFV